MRLHILLRFEYEGSSGWAKSFIFITQACNSLLFLFLCTPCLVVGVVKLPEDVSVLFPFPCPFEHKEMLPGMRWERNGGVPLHAEAA